MYFGFRSKTLFVHLDYKSSLANIKVFLILNSEATINKNTSHGIFDDSNKLPTYSQGDPLDAKCY